MVKRKSKKPAGSVSVRRRLTDLRTVCPEAMQKSNQELIRLLKKIGRLDLIPEALRTESRERRLWLEGKLHLSLSRLEEYGYYNRRKKSLHIPANAIGVRGYDDLYKVEWKFAVLSEENYPEPSADMKWFRIELWMPRQPGNAEKDEPFAFVKRRIEDLTKNFSGQKVFNCGAVALSTLVLLVSYLVGQ